MTIKYNFFIIIFLFFNNIKWMKMVKCNNSVKTLEPSYVMYNKLYIHNDSLSYFCCDSYISLPQQKDKWMLFERFKMSLYGMYEWNMTNKCFISSNIFTKTFKSYTNNWYLKRSIFEIRQATMMKKHLQKYLSGHI